MLPPHWADEVIDAVIATGDAEAIAAAIANSDTFVAAIRRGLENEPIAGVAGPSHAQQIRSELQTVFSG